MYSKSKPVLILSIMFLVAISCWPSISQATDVTNQGKGKLKTKWDSGVILAGEAEPVPVLATYVLFAHPYSGVTNKGIKNSGPPTNFIDNSGVLGVGELHGTRGWGTAESVLRRVHMPPVKPFFVWRNEVSATIQPGFNETAAQVSFWTRLSDPLVVGPGITDFYGAMDIEVTLEAGTFFAGVPAIPSMASDPQIGMKARVAPGQHPNPEEFFGDGIPNATDIYDLEIRESNTSGLVEATATLGGDNAYFTLNFDATPSEIESRITSAFSGTPGDHQVTSDVVLFNVAVTPSDTALVYTFGPAQESLAPNVERPMCPDEIHKDSQGAAAGLQVLYSGTGGTLRGVNVISTPPGCSHPYIEVVNGDQINFGWQTPCFDYCKTIEYEFIVDPPCGEVFVTHIEWTYPPPIPPYPTLSQWILILLAISVAGYFAWVLMKKREGTAS